MAHRAPVSTKSGPTGIARSTESDSADLGPGRLLGGSRVAGGGQKRRHGLQRMFGARTVQVLSRSNELPPPSVTGSPTGAQALSTASQVGSSGTHRGACAHAAARARPRWRSARSCPAASASGSASPRAPRGACSPPRRAAPWCSSTRPAASASRSSGGISPPSRAPPSPRAAACSPSRLTARTRCGACRRRRLTLAPSTSPRIGAVLRLPLSPSSSSSRRLWLCPLASASGFVPRLFFPRPPLLLSSSPSARLAMALSLLGGPSKASGCRGIRPPVVRREGLGGRLCPPEMRRRGLVYPGHLTRRGYGTRERLHADAAMLAHIRAEAPQGCRDARALRRHKLGRPPRRWENTPVEVLATEWWTSPHFP